MSRTSEITKEMIIDAGIDIVRKQGRASLSARNLAKHLGCSTQPVYYYFKNIEMVDKEITKKAYEMMIKKYRYKNTEDDKFLRMGLGYIEFAQKESNLFEYLYFSRCSDGIADEDYSSMRNNIMQDKQTDTADDYTRARTFEKLDLFIHGLAVTLMSKPDLYTAAEIRRLITDAASAIVKWETERSYEGADEYRSSSSGYNYYSYRLSNPRIDIPYARPHIQPGFCQGNYTFSGSRSGFLRQNTFFL